MILISEKQKKILIDNMPNAEEILATDDLSVLFEALDSFITDVGFDDNDELTDTGYVYQNIYDAIYRQNKYPEEFPV